MDEICFGNCFITVHVSFLKWVAWLKSIGFFSYFDCSCCLFYWSHYICFWITYWNFSSRALDQALSKTLTVDELFYLREQFSLLEPSKKGSINLENIKAVGYVSIFFKMLREDISHLTTLGCLRSWWWMQQMLWTSHAYLTFWHQLSTMI